MKLISKSLLTAAILGMTVVSAQAADTSSCKTMVQSIKNEWKAVDFPTASKPTAVRVEGKLGHENTAAQVSYMQGQIKQADAECKAGNSQAALQRVSSIHEMLDSHGISQETANAAMTPQ